LALVTITARRTRASIASFHLSALLLVAFSVYVYRDVLAAAYFHACASRSLGRRIALTQDRPPFCPGYRHPVAYPASICSTRSQGEILFLVSSSRVLLTPSVASTDDHQSRADGVPFVYDDLFIPRFHSIVFLASRVPHLSHDMLPPLADYDYTKNLVQRSFKVCVYSSARFCYSYSARL
jgi:hypothetical protein